MSHFHAGRRLSGLADIADDRGSGDSEGMHYEIMPQSNRRFSFIPSDLRYFNNHFVCQPMIKNWELPPVSIDGKSYKAADFVAWMLRAPVVSLRAKNVLADICGDLVEFLPFHPVKGTPYFAINVLSRDRLQPIFKTDPNSVVFVDERIGEVIRDSGLSGVALTDPSTNIGRRIVRGESVHDFPGLVG